MNEETSISKWTIATLKTLTFSSFVIFVYKWISLQLLWWMSKGSVWIMWTFLLTKIMFAEFCFMFLLIKFRISMIPIIILFFTFWYYCWRDLLSYLFVLLMKLCSIRFITIFPIKFCIIWFCLICIIIICIIEILIYI